MAAKTTTLRTTETVVFPPLIQSEVRKSREAAQIALVQPAWHGHRAFQPPQCRSPRSSANRSEFQRSLAHPCECQRIPAHPSDSNESQRIPMNRSEAAPTQRISESQQTPTNPADPNESQPLQADLCEFQRVPAPPSESQRNSSAFQRFP